MKSKVVNLFFTLVTLIFVAGCFQPFSSEPTPNNIIKADFNSPVQLNIHQTAIMEPQGVKVEFSEITEDSRCPLDVSCIHEGQVTATFDIETSNNGQANHHLIRLTQKASQTDLAIDNFDGYSIQLIDVEPKPTTNKTIVASDYLVTLVVSQL